MKKSESKLPFDASFRADLVRAAQTAYAGGIETTPFWGEVEKELSRISMEPRKTSVEPRKIKS